MRLAEHRIFRRLITPRAKQGNQPMGGSVPIPCKCKHDLLVPPMAGSMTLTNHRKHVGKLFKIKRPCTRRGPSRVAASLVRAGLSNAVFPCVHIRGNVLLTSSSVLGNQNDGH